MERSTRFRSLSGLSGVFAGGFALIATYLAQQMVIARLGRPGYEPLNLSGADFWLLMGLACGTIVLSLGAVIFFSQRTANKQNRSWWNHQTQRVGIHFFIPLVAGGLLCLLLLSKGYLGWVFPLTLIFYGLALVNASKFTFGEIFFLGLLEIALGLFSAQFIEWGLLCWALGFGLLNVLSGLLLHAKYRL